MFAAKKIWWLKEKQLLITKAILFCMMKYIENLIAAVE
jgi:hypothetical protein